MLPLDLTNLDAAASKVETAIGFHGCIDVLINNGGISSRGNVRDTLLDVHTKVMNVNYFGQVALTKGIFGFLCAFMVGCNNGCRKGRCVISLICFV